MEVMYNQSPANQEAKNWQWEQLNKIGNCWSLMSELPKGSSKNNDVKKKIDLCLVLHYTSA